MKACLARILEEVKNEVEKLCRGQNALYIGENAPQAMHKLQPGMDPLISVLQVRAAFQLSNRSLWSPDG